MSTTSGGVESLPVIVAKQLIMRHSGETPRSRVTRPASKSRHSQSLQTVYVVIAIQVHGPDYRGRTSSSTASGSRKAVYGCDATRNIVLGHPSIISSP